VLSKGQEFAVNVKGEGGRAESWGFDGITEFSELTELGGRQKNLTGKHEDMKYMKKAGSRGIFDGMNGIYGVDKVAVARRATVPFSGGPDNSLSGFARNHSARTGGRRRIRDSKGVGE